MTTDEAPKNQPEPEPLSTVAGDAPHASDRPYVADEANAQSQPTGPLPRVDPSPTGPSAPPEGPSTDDAHTAEVTPTIARGTAEGGSDGETAASEREPRPTTVLGLIEYAYAKAGNKLEVVKKDLQQIKHDPAAADAEMAALRRHAKKDTYLAVPPSILATFAELDAPYLVKQRVLELVLAALVDHPVFSGLAMELAHPESDPPLTALVVSESARKQTFAHLGFEVTTDYKEPARERLRVNAVVAFELFRIVRDAWPFERFVEDMAELVWTTPNQKTTGRAAAVLVSNRTIDALSQLARHFGRVTAEASRQTASARANARTQQRRAEDAERAGRDLEAQLLAEREHARGLAGQVASLTRSLESERSHRVVDQSHHADDYEALRTQVVRRLSTQVSLLTDGLHALRNGRTAVAEEFLDRALTAIGGEVTRLREMGEEDL